MAKYSVVQFEDGLQVVPTIWLKESNTMCMWPNTTNAKNITKAVVHAESPDEETWATLSLLRVFGSASTYETAIFKLKLAQKLSDIETGSDDGENRPKKNRQSRARICISSSDEELELQRGSTKSHPKKLPPTPKLPKNLSKIREAKTMENADVDRIPEDRRETNKTFHRGTVGIRENSDASENQNFQPNTFRKRTWEMREKSHASVDDDIQPSTSRRRIVETRDSSTDTWENQDNSLQPKPSRECTMGLIEKPSASASEDFRTAPKQPDIEKITQKKILKKLGKISYHVYCLNEKFDHYFDNNNNQIAPVKVTAADLENEEIDFPLKSEEDIKNMEKSWAKPSCFKSAVEYFQKIGGTDLHGIVINMLKRLLTNEMAVKYSWVGARKKKAFRETKMQSLLMSTVRRRFSDATEKQIEDPTAKWLAQAQVRLHRAQNRKSRTQSDSTLKDDTARDAALQVQQRKPAEEKTIQLNSESVN